MSGPVLAPPYSRKKLFAALSTIKSRVCTVWAVFFAKVVNLMVTQAQHRSLSGDARSAAHQSGSMPSIIIMHAPGLDVGSFGGRRLKLVRSSR